MADKRIDQLADSPAVTLTDLIPNAPSSAPTVATKTTIQKVKTLIGDMEFADATARAAAVPSHEGQRGIQLDTNTEYTATGTSAGNWQLPSNTQIQSDTYAVASGTNAYSITLIPDLGAYASGNTFKVKFTNANTGVSTLNVNGLGAKSIKKNGSSALIGGEIQAGSIITLIYDGTNFQIDNSAYIIAPYKKYVALLTQTGTADPSVIVLENNIGTIVWVRNATGEYVGSRTAAFTNNKTVVFIGNSAFMTAAFWFDDTNIQVNTFNGSAVASDALLNVTSIEIRVYQ